MLTAAGSNGSDENSPVSRDDFSVVAVVTVI